MWAIGQAYYLRQYIYDLGSLDVVYKCRIQVYDIAMVETMSYTSVVYKYDIAMVETMDDSK